MKKILKTTIALAIAVLIHEGSFAQESVVPGDAQFSESDRNVRTHMTSPQIKCVREQNESDVEKTDIVGVDFYEKPNPKIILKLKNNIDCAYVAKFEQGSNSQDFVGNWNKRLPARCPNQVLFRNNPPHLIRTDGEVKNGRSESETAGQILLECQSPQNSLSRPE